VVIVYHFAGSVKQYLQVHDSPGCGVPLPQCCPHPECQAEGRLIRWGTYHRWVWLSGDKAYWLRIQRVRCKECGRTHSLLPDFLHPHRYYVLDLLQQVVTLYLMAGLGFGRLMKRLPETGPVRSTVREWVRAFAYGAGHLLLAVLSRTVFSLAPESELPVSTPPHLCRSHQSRQLQRAYHFWQLAEQLYAQVKMRQPWLHFAATELSAFLLHWLGQQGLPARLFWSPALATTPTTPF
jgi:transposase-like protein